jgi:hypothetical protein
VINNAIIYIGYIIDFDSMQCEFDPGIPECEILIDLEVILNAILAPSVLEGTFPYSLSASTHRTHELVLE